MKISIEDFYDVRRSRSKTVNGFKYISESIWDISNGNITTYFTLKKDKRFWRVEQVEMGYQGEVEFWEPDGNVIGDYDCGDCEFELEEVFAVIETVYKTKRELK